MTTKSVTIGQGFPRRVRLLQAHEFRQVFNKPIKFYHPYVTFCVKINELDFSRLGVTIPRRNIRHAVDRNRIRRMIREGFRLHLSQLGHVDIVVQVKQGTENCEKKALFKDLSLLWQEVADF